MYILDTIVFCWKRVSKVIHRTWHSYWGHYDLTFDELAGRQEFREDINRIFMRNGIAYELTEEGRIERLAYSVLREQLASPQFHTGDKELDNLLEKARRKFLGPDEEMRREALEELWDAWERLKTLNPDLRKKQGIKNLLERASGASSPKFRDRLEREASELTYIGNELNIRHSETYQERLAMSEHVDYLFHRLFGLIQLILKTNDSSIHRVGNQ